MGENEHTMLEREVADIIISLLHRQGSNSGRRFHCLGIRAARSDFCVLSWGVKRKRSVLPLSHARSTHGSSNNGEPPSVSISNNPGISTSPSSICEEPDSPPKSSKISFVDKEKLNPPAAVPLYNHRRPNEWEACFNQENFESGSFFWPTWGGGGREFVLPDLNMSAEELVAATADAELLRRQHELYEMAGRRLAAARARRRRRELQKLKNSIAAGSPLCSRVR